MEEDKFCRRCSVVRVNTLCLLYDQGMKEKDDKALEDLKAMVRLAEKRGYKEGNKVLEAGLDSSVVRRLCWNISSLLTDGDFQTRGIKLGN